MMMNFQEWEVNIPQEFKADALWKVTAYRYGLFASDLGWFDVTRLIKDKRTTEIADQLYRSLGSISANLAEGYSRGTGKDRARFYENSLGSARESRDWYFKGRHVLGNEVFQHCSKFLTEIIHLLLTMVPQQRGRTLREEQADYKVGSDFEDLLTNIPVTE